MFSGTPLHRLGDVGEKPGLLTIVVQVEQRPGLTVIVVALTVVVNEPPPKCPPCTNPKEYCEPASLDF